MAGTVVPEPATLPEQEGSSWPLSGTPRGIRAAYVVTLFQSLKGEQTVRQIIDNMGWPDDKAEQVWHDTLQFISYLLDESGNAK